jgi:hypothetical protein
MHAGLLPEAWGQMRMFRLPQPAAADTTLLSLLFDVRCGHVQPHVGGSFPQLVNAQ